MGWSKSSRKPEHMEKMRGGAAVGWGWPGGSVGRGTCRQAGSFNSILGTHMVEGENVLQELVLKLAMAYMYIKEQGLGVG